MNQITITVIFMGALMFFNGIFDKTKNLQLKQKNQIITQNLKKINILS